MKKNMGLFVILIAVIAGYFLVAQKRFSPQVNANKHKEYVNALLSKGLYNHAVSEYRKLFDFPGLSNRQRANLAYLIGNIYMENLSDYENALASYLKIDVLTPDSPMKNEINQKIVECLERIGRPLDAQAQMEQNTLLNKEPGQPKKGGVVVARIGERSITMGELEGKIKDMPPYYQEQYKDKAKRLDFLKQYVAQELFYNAAKRKGCENDKEIIAQAFEMKKGLMIQKLLKEEIQDRINITPKEIELYYEAHKKEFTEKGKQETLAEAKDRIKEILNAEKEKDLYMEFMKKIFEAQQVKIYDDLFETQKKPQK